MSWELVLYTTRYILIFRLPRAEDFVVDKVVKFKTKRDAEARIKGENAWRETVDVPYSPMFLYSVRRGKRKLVWKQGWDDCWGSPVVYPQEPKGSRARSLPRVHER